MLKVVLWGPQGLGFFLYNQDSMFSTDQVVTSHYYGVPPCTVDCTCCLHTCYSPEHPSNGTDITDLNVCPLQATVFGPGFAGTG